MAPTDKTSFQEWVGGIIARECPHEGLSLDVGCGECRYRQAFKNRLVGYDLDRSVAPDVRGGMTRLPFRDRCFAFATSFQCLYYCRDGREAVDELVRVLVPRGCAASYTDFLPISMAFFFCIGFSTPFRMGFRSIWHPNMAPKID